MLEEKVAYGTAKLLVSLHPFSSVLPLQSQMHISFKVLDVFAHKCWQGFSERPLDIKSLLVHSGFEEDLTIN